MKPSFDCARAATATEKAICASPAIATLDRVMAEAYGKIYAARRGTARSALVRQQKEWLKRRNACGADVACLATVYSTRISELQ